MKLLFLILLSLVFYFQGYAQTTEFLKDTDCQIILNQSYGTHERNTFDIILPKNPEAHALVIYVHGGGFTHGDKNELYYKKETIPFLLNHNIAVATINYRFFKNNDSLGVQKCLDDVKRALQYLRFHAKEYNIDKTRIGIFGGSAGAGSSLYLAFRDDMANPNDTTLLGESTRVSCAGAFETQSTYNVFAWKKVLPCFRTISFLKRKMLYHAAANFYGFPNYRSFKPHRKEITQNLDMLEMIDTNDPPVYLMNLMTQKIPLNDNIVQHHRKHAIWLSRKLHRNKVKHYLYTNKDLNEQGKVDFSIGEFFVENLNQP